MSRLLNCFGKINALVNSNGVVLLEANAAGTYNLDLGQGIYRIVLIGGGGGGAKMYWAAGHEVFYRYAKGGVAATADVYVDVPTNCSATIVVGTGGSSDSRGNYDTTATDGAPSYITGIPNLVLNCGNGTAGNIYSHTSTPGTMGNLTLSGDAILRVDMNSNDHPIISTATSGVRTNTNWPTNTAFGRGGGCSAGQGGTVWSGGVGYCLIRYYNRNYFNLDEV